MDNVEECGFVSSVFAALLALSSGVQIPDASLFTSTSTLNPAFSSPAVPSVQFEDVDYDRNGQVSTEEILGKINQMMDVNIRKDGLEKLFNLVDTNMDGQLSAQEDNAELMDQYNVTKNGDEYEIRLKGQTVDQRIELGIIGGLLAVLLIPTSVVVMSYSKRMAAAKKANDQAKELKRQEAEEIRAYNEAQKKRNALKREYRKNRKKIGKLRL